MEGNPSPVVRGPKVCTRQHIFFTSGSACPLVTMHDLQLDIGYARLHLETVRG